MIQMSYIWTSHGRDSSATALPYGLLSRKERGIEYYNDDKDDNIKSDDT